MDNTPKARRNSLIEAIFNSDRDAFLQAIANGADIDSRGEDMRSVLHDAVSFSAMLGENQMLQAVIDHGADLDAQDDMGLTALHLAAAMNETECATMLLHAGANPFISDQDGRFPSQHVHASPVLETNLEAAETKWQRDRAAERREFLTDVAQAARPTEELATAQHVQAKRQAYGRSM